MIFLLFSIPALGQEHKEREYETAMTKGTFAVETGDYASAIGQFKKALEIKPNDKAALLSLGIAFSRAGDLVKAAEALRGALSIDPSDQRIRYELGIVLFKRGEREAAREHFSAVAELAVDEELKLAAKSRLDRIAAREGEKKLSLTLQGGLQYDSNVILDPRNPAVPPREKKSDSRAVVTVDGKYSFADRGAFSAEAEYLFYQSLHFNLEDLNIQQHNLGLAARSAVSGKSLIGLSYSFSYSGVGGDHYSTVHAVRPALDMKLSPQSLTKLQLGYESKRFFNSAVFTGNADRTATNIAAGVTHTAMLTGKTGLALGYAYDSDDADADAWDSAGHRGSLRLQSDTRLFTALVTASFTDRKYDAASSPLTPRRHDQTQEYSVGLSRNIAKTIRLNLSDTYTLNDSNLAQYEYTRNIIGLFAEMGL